MALCGNEFHSLTTLRLKMVQWEGNMRRLCRMKWRLYSIYLNYDTYLYVTHNDSLHLTKCNDNFLAHPIPILGQPMGRAIFGSTGMYSMGFCLWAALWFGHYPAIWISAIYVPYHSSLSTKSWTLIGEEINDQISINVQTTKYKNYFKN